MIHRAKYNMHTIKILEKKTENLHELGFGDEFSDTILRAWFIKEKNWQLGPYKISNFLVCERC